MFLELLKKVVFRYTNFGNPTYPFNIEPSQLSKLTTLLDELSGKEGNLVEIGVARGQTTLFLSKHIENTNYLKANKDFKYYAIDTFSSFIEKDIKYEIKNRGKTRRELRGFRYNSFDKWKKNFNNYHFVKPIKTDCSIFNYESISPLKLVFIDVDLYLPTKKTLNKIYKYVTKGGYILIDDVLDNKSWDGAFQAYMEFSAENNLEPIIIGNKCGLIQKK